MMTTPSIAVFITSMSIQIIFPCTFHLVNHFQQILPVRILQHRLRQLLHFLTVNPSFAISDTFQTSHFQSLPFLNHLNIGSASERSRAVPVSAKRILCPRSVPSVPYPPRTAVHGGNLQLPTCRRLDMFGYIHHFIRIEIKPDYRIVGFWLFRLFSRRGNYLLYQTQPHHSVPDH